MATAVAVTAAGSMGKALQVVGKAGGAAVVVMAEARASNLQASVFFSCCPLCDGQQQEGKNFAYLVC